MIEYNTEQLNQQFGYAENNNTLLFKQGADNIPWVEIKNRFCRAQISLQGANILSFISGQKNDLIWVSEDAVFAKGKSVRGGIPICWPWFGAHATNTNFPAHGFARTAPWQVQSTEQLTSGETQIIFILKTDTLGESIHTLWPHSCTLKYTIILGETLSLTLTTLNHTDHSICIGEALHTYFNIQDITQTTVSGLDGIEYLDKPDAFKRKQQKGNIIVREEVDRVYVQTENETHIDNGKTKITIQKKNSLSTIVWNPWKKVAEKMGDLGPSGYLHMLCVESGNVAENTINIKPGDSHTLSVVYSIE